MKDEGKIMNIGKEFLEHTNCVYVDELLFYYNKDHGYGSNH